MAFRICPECGGKVSDSRDNCPHCGYVFEQTVVCPECGEQISDKAKKCVYCSVDLTVEDKQVADSTETENVKDRTDYAQQFLVDTPQFERTKKNLERGRTVYHKIWFFLLCGWEALVGLLAYFVLSNELSFGTVSAFVMFGTVMLAAVILLNAWFEYYPTYKYIKNCMAWMKSTNYTLYDYINNQYVACINSGNVDAIIELFDFTAAYYYMMNDDKFRAYKTHLIIRTAICIAIAAWLIFGLSFVIGHGVTAGFDKAVLLSAIIPTTVLFLVYFVTYICLTLRDYKSVRSVYKDIR